MKNKLITLSTLIIFCLNFVVFSPALAVLVNGVPQDSGQVTNPNQQYATTNTSTYNVTAGAGPNTYTTPSQVIPNIVSGRWSEDTLRSFFTQYNVNVDSGNLYGIGNFAITGAISLKRTVDYYTNTNQGCSVPLTNLKVIAGSETYGQDSPILDFAADDNLTYFIHHMATSRGATPNGDLYQFGDDYFYNNGNRWHIIFGPSNGAFVKNVINFFGMVRDNFNVQHPMITDTNTPSAVNFNRNLNLGAKGQDVHDLQLLLNTDPYTQIAQSGPGSPGNETNYFGSLTKKAVYRYQFKYNEILDAAGITTPTGFFGPFTRSSMGAYFNYIKALKTSGNRDTLQYPTPTKPQEDVALHSTSAPCGNTSSGTSTTTTPADPIVVNTTPGAPNYPGYDTDPLNNTPAFYQNGYNYGTQDPNNSENSSSQGATPQQSQSGSGQNPLSQLAPIISLLALNKFTAPTTPRTPTNTGNNTGTGGLPFFGGLTVYNAAPNHLTDIFRPCGCSPGVIDLINDNSRAPNGPKPIALVNDPALVEGLCATGNYSPGGIALSCASCIPLTSGQTGDPICNNMGKCIPGPGIEFAGGYPPLMPIGVVIPSQSQSSANACAAPGI
jgi:hypothetical protein